MYYIYNMGISLSSFYDFSGRARIICQYIKQTEKKMPENTESGHNILNKTEKMGDMK